MQQFIWHSDEYSSIPTWSFPDKNTNIAENPQVKTS